MTTKELVNSVIAYFTPRRRRRFRQLLGVSVFVLLSWQITQEGRFSSWWQNLKSATYSSEQLMYLLLALLLMPFNWLLETAKWRQLLSSNWQASWWTTMKAVLAGISVSLLTPNRIGEYGGRAILAPAEQTGNVVFSSLVGSLCQWLAFLACGWPSLCWLLTSYYDWPVSLKLFSSWVVPGLIALSLLAARLEKLRKWWSRWSAHNRWWRWLRRRIGINKPIGYTQFMIAFSLALLRFLIYSFQYLLLLWFFNLSLGFSEGMMGIFSIYLIQAGIPLPPGFSVITRSELALLVWGNEIFDPLPVVSATFGVYLINLLIPALLGVGLIVRNEKKSK